MESKEIKPIELCIECDDVVKRYPISEAMEIVRCKTSIFFHSTGFFAVSKPTVANNFKGGPLFEMLQWYCDYMDTRDSYPQDKQEKYDTFCAMIVNILSLPIDIFTDVNFMLDVANYIVKKRGEYYKRVWDESQKPREDTLEDELKNIEFEAEVMAGEQLKEELGEMARRGKVSKKKKNGNADNGSN